MSEVDYRQSGVDIDAGNEDVRRIKALARATYTPGVLSGVGSFGGLVRARDRRRRSRARRKRRWRRDEAQGRVHGGVHDTIGVDLVNHCVNDILVQGARRCSFSTIWRPAGSRRTWRSRSCAAWRRVPRERVRAARRRDRGDAGFYADGEDDVAGFIVGVVARARIVDGREHRRRRRADRAALDRVCTRTATRSRDELSSTRSGCASTARSPSSARRLAPRCCVRTVVFEGRHAAARTGVIKGMAHITGGGITENVPRMLPDGRSFSLDRQSWTVPPLFRWLQRAGRSTDAEMFRAFNMGVGLVLACAPSDVDAILAALRSG